jgi:hypothetical protein
VPVLALLLVGAISALTIWGALQLAVMSLGLMSPALEWTHLPASVAVVLELLLAPVISLLIAVNNIALHLHRPPLAAWVTGVVV